MTFLQSLVDKMREADVDRAGHADLKLNWGDKVGSKQKMAKLITYVNETLFQRPVYATLIEVYKKRLFEPEVCKSEQEIDGFRKAQLEDVFNTWTDTEVFKVAFDYLRNIGYEHATDMKTLKDFLFNLWFGTYSRCKGRYQGSS
ncbi:Endoribonuclease XendoU, partial [Trichostrongylus colubriformis]